MSLFALGDLHLAFGVPDKSMSVFGGRWIDYESKLISGFSHLSAEDTTVLCGDFCWAMDLEEALPDFQFLHNLPGRKILIKGNHDLWWTSMKKMQAFLAEHQFDDISILYNNCYFYDDAAICGTRGWFFEEETGSDHDRLVLAREVGRLNASLKMAGEVQRKIAFLHYPPIYQGYRCEEMLQALSQGGVSDCYYGHLHSKGCASAFLGDDSGICYHLISADYLDFIPQKVL